MTAALLVALAGACYPNPEDLRGGSGSGSGGQASGGVSGAAGASGVGGHVGAGGMPGGTGGAMTTQCGGTACGGNLLGTWAFFKSCPAPTTFDCAGEVLDASGVHRAGTLAFESNGTYATTETDTGTFIFDVPSTCLSGGSCASLQAVYQGAGYVGPPNPTFSSATCTTTTTGCHCLLGALGIPMTITGTYVTSGNSVTSTSSTGVVDADTYCVTGTILRLIYPTSTPAVPDESLLMKQ